MCAASPYGLLGIREGARPAEVHRAAAAKIELLNREAAAGRLDPDSCDQEYVRVYAAVANLLGLRMGFGRPVEAPGVDSAAVGAGVNATFALWESTVSAGPSPMRPGSPRLPCECEICGWFPAVPVTSVWVLSVFLAAKVRRETKVLCRGCGISETRKAQGYTRRWGSLGTGFIASFLARWQNRSTLRALRRFPEPYARRPGVLSLETMPRRSGWLGAWTGLR